MQRAAAAPEHPAFPPRLVLLLAVLSLGFAAILIRWVGDAPAPTIAFYRLFFTALLLAPFALTRHRHEFRRISRRDLLVAIGIGVVLALHFASWIESLFHTSVASSVIIVSTEALFAAMGAAIILRERLRLTEWGLIAMAFLGVALIALADAGAETRAVFPNAAYGNLLALLGALAAAVYLVGGRSLRQRVHLLVYVTIVYWAASATLFVFVLVSGSPLSGFAPTTWLLFLLMAIFPTIGGHTLINWCLRYLPAAPVSTAVIGEPLIATALAILFFTEIPGPLAALGGALALLGIVGIVRRRAEPRASAQVTGPT